jgi:NADP-dependent 3-hydroxy acid dehydrogenase YdfG
MSAGTLTGKVVLVTGAGTGIGRSAALMFAAAGAQVAVAGRRRGPLDAVVAEITKAGGRAAAHAADVADAGQARGLAAWALATFGRVDVLVNNAGFSSLARSIRWIGDEEWERVFSVNVAGVYRLTQALLPSMIERGGGTVITVSSVAGIRPSGLAGPAYSAAKAAARNLMGHIHTELRTKGIRATTILPAEVDTPILDKRPLPPDARARSTMMQPEDVAEAIVLCAALPARTVIEEIVMSPTMPRDVSADLQAGFRVGAPEGAR